MAWGRGMAPPPSRRQSYSGEGSVTLRRRGATALSLVALSLVLVACGGGSAAVPTSPAKPAGTVVAVTPSAGTPAIGTPAARPPVATPGAGGTPVSDNPAAKAAIDDLAK